MLETVGVESIEELFVDIPSVVRCKGRLNLPGPLSEMEMVRHMKALAGKNKNLDDYACFLGAGAYDHYVPSIINHILLRQEFYTAYTPYQPEVSQGTLQAIFEYQTMICELTGMEVSNASVYDGASALAEAVAMACQATRRGEVMLSRTVHPEAREVVKTYSRFSGVSIKELGCQNGLTGLREAEERINDQISAIVVQNPNYFGALEDLTKFAELAHRHKALLIVSADPIALGLLKPPGETGADIVVGEGQTLGNSLSFGGPYFGFMATTEKLMRRLPGRIVGQTTDSEGNRGFILTLQAREQHIRREKATSNICSNQALCALAATVYLTVLGKKGLRRVAELCLQKAHYTYRSLLETGKFAPTFTAPFFKEFAVTSQEDTAVVNARLMENKIIGGYPLDRDYPELKNSLLVAVTESRTRDEIDRLVKYSVITK
ncbi:aminomethyl-transferring glycine dehydrogenase subunit GcvPA [Pelotomaculum isophthalicicum JI]|uniref:Probable glycine dehydrogenase (decarboxylating) subunit 1 n=2 Tax=Pelotomaculum TaxID=191373 RepID=A0A9X4H850_9FIRM|nr:aminomethyl-transferring glycine dehydrogenase subunit GcvPA [Pelotomaculum isophthalicicum JI]